MLQFNHEARGRSQWVRTLLPYVLAVGSVALALAVLLGFRKELQPHVYAVFLFAIVATALFGGLRPALTSVILALAASNYLEYLDARRVHLGFEDVIQLSIFATIGVSISLLMTQRRRAESELARANEELRQLDHAKDEFIATVSHELRTPVTVILGWASILRQEDGEELRTTASQAIEQSARAQSRLIEDLLDMSRLTLGKLHLDRAPVALVSVVDQATAMARPAAEEKRVELSTGLPREPCVVDGDATRLQQICWNLISNALKFTPAGGHIDVRLAHDERNAEISVTDTGEGIPAELLPRIFEPLRQGRDSMAKGGLGLGLSIVRQLVSMHGGTVEATSPGPGMGARFTVRLPLLPASK